MHFFNWSWPKLSGSARLAALSMLLACGVLLVTARPVAAQLIERSHDHIVETIPDDQVCDVPVTTTIDFIVNVQERLAKSGFPLFKNTGRGTITWTNPVNGKSVTGFFAGAFKDLTVVDNGDGTITLRTALTGIAEKIRLAHGRPATMDVGRVVSVAVLDYNGTPTDTDDDVLISESIESISGRAPDLQSDFALFCQVVVPGLT